MWYLKNKGTSTQRFLREMLLRKEENSTFSSNVSRRGHCVAYPLPCLPTMSYAGDVALLTHSGCASPGCFTTIEVFYHFYLLQPDARIDRLPATVEDIVFKKYR
jgi:hypothetical protein